MDPNTQCFSCGWTFHVAPKNASRVTACPACGSDDIHSDDEILALPQIDSARAMDRNAQEGR